MKKEPRLETAMSQDWRKGVGFLIGLWLAFQLLLPLVSR